MGNILYCQTCANRNHEKPTGAEDDDEDDEDDEEPFRRLLGGCLAGVDDFLADMVGWMMCQGILNGQRKVCVVFNHG